MPGNPDAYVNRTYDQTVGAGRSVRRRDHPVASGDRLDRWPRRLDLKILARSSRTADPWGEDFDYATEFSSLDLDQLARDVDQVLTTPAGLVARRLRPLRTAGSADGVALRRHLPRR